MEKETFLQLVDKLLDITVKEIREQAKSILKSGCLDLEEENTYYLPKCFLAAALRDQAKQWEPLTIAGKEESANIELFL